jgi:predicted outer membrane repeat protein
MLVPQVRALTPITPSLDAPNAVYGGKDLIYRLEIVLDRDPKTATSAKDRNDCMSQERSGVCATVELLTEQPGSTSFVVSTNFSHIDNEFTENRCLDEDIAIQFFKDHHLLECLLPCRRRDKVLFSVMQEFAGIARFDSVLTRDAFPTDLCLLGSNWKGTSSYDEIVTLLRDLGYIANNLKGCATATALGCDKLQIAAKLTGADGTEMSTSTTIEATISEKFPNQPPMLSGDLGFLEMEIGAQVELPSFELIDPDADIVLLQLETTGVVKIASMLPPQKSAGKSNKNVFVAPEFAPTFLSGDANGFWKEIKVRCTLEQAQNALASMVLMTETLGINNLTITVDDEGRHGYPARASSLQDSKHFSIQTKPSLKPPSVRIVNSDESWRFDWRPGVRYMKGGVEVGIDDDLFPCGGDTLYGRFWFPKNGSGKAEDPFGWQGVLPSGEGDEDQLKRNCRDYPDTFWKKGEKALYATLDEGGKARVFVQMQTASSGCNETTKYKVTIAITNANHSRLNLPIAEVDGYRMDWFECRDGKWYCKNRHPMLTLDNANGARDRLNFHYDQIHRHLSDGIQDYRMTFTGEHADVASVLSNITVEFPWLDESGTERQGSEEPWPFKTWPRTGRSLIGSNILRVRIEDVPADYIFEEKAHQMWTVKGAYRYARLEIGEAKLECQNDPTCYGFQYLTTNQLAGIVEQQVLPSVQLGNNAGQPWLHSNKTFQSAGGFSDRPPTIWGLGDTTWDELLVSKEIDWKDLTAEKLPNTFFFRESFDRFDIQPYRYNALTFTRKEKTNICLGKFANTERLLDIRVLTMPLNQPPIISVDKPFWRIQKAYEFPVPGIRMYDGDAMWMKSKMEITFKATRGFFSFPTTNGLEFRVGDGTLDENQSIFRCLYTDCQQAVRDIRYKSVEVPGIDVISVFIDDRGNSGELGALEASISITLSLAAGPYNVPPIVQIPGLPARVAHPGQRVDISGIFVEDIDLDQPRWDKPYAEGYLTVHIEIGRGFFDVTRLRQHGLIKSLKLGPADDEPDGDCPCWNASSVGGPAGKCPCNQWVTTQYTKISGLKRDIKWAVAQVSVYLDFDQPYITNPIDTRLVITVNDNCNTGFSDDSGVQKPCLLDTDSVVIRIVPKPAEQTSLYVSPKIGIDATVGTFVHAMLETESNNMYTLVRLMSNASSVDGIYDGLKVDITAGLHAGQTGMVVGYNGTERLMRVAFKPEVLPDNSSEYTINCGIKRLPCRSLSRILKESPEHAQVLAMPGIYVGRGNIGLDFMGKTLKLRSTHGYNDTIIDCGGAVGPVATFSPTAQSQVYIDGFSFRNCMGKDGAAVVFRQIRTSKVGSVNDAGKEKASCSAMQGDGNKYQSSANMCRNSPIFRRCYFYNNLASGFGGAIYVKDGSPVFEECIFYNNAANSGGAVYIRGGLPLFRKCLFSWNAAQLGGGALLVNGGRVMVNECKFQMNAATRAGGAISMTAGVMEMQDSSMTNNYAGEADGGVFVGGGDASFKSCTDDANSIGHIASQVLDQIQSRQKNSYLEQYGASEHIGVQNENPLAIL